MLQEQTVPRATFELLKKFLNIRLCKMKIFFITTFVFITSLAVAQPCSYKDLEQTITSLYTKVKPCNLSIAKMDFTPVLLYKETDFLGAIGTHKKRLVVQFTSIKKDNTQPSLYQVEGWTRVAKNTRKFRGTIVINTLKTLVNSEETDFKEEGIAEGNFLFDEYENLPVTGIFKGKVLLCWAISNKGNLEYNDFYEGADPYFNNAFIGTWTSKQTQKTQQVSWAHLRVPCSGDLDIGAGEFIPNKKYLKYGWDEFINEMKAQYPGYTPYN